MKTFLTVLLIIVVVCFLIGCIRVGGIVEYSEEGVVARVRIGLLKIKVFPMKKKKKKRTPTSRRTRRKRNRKRRKKPNPPVIPPKRGRRRKPPRRRAAPSSW